GRRVLARPRPAGGDRARERTHVRGAGPAERPPGGPRARAHGAARGDEPRADPGLRRAEERRDPARPLREDGLARPPGGRRGARDQQPRELHLEQRRAAHPPSPAGGGQRPAAHAGGAPRSRGAGRHHGARGGAHGGDREGPAQLLPSRRGHAQGGRPARGARGDAPPPRAALARARRHPPRLRRAPPRRVRPGPAEPGVHEPARQRLRRDRGHGQHLGHDARRGRYGERRDPRRRGRHPARRRRPHLRPLLHHQGRGPRDGARARGEPRGGGGPWRADRGRERARRREHLPRHAAGRYGGHAPGAGVRLTAAGLRRRRPSRIEPGGAMGAEESAAAVAPVEAGGRAQLARRAGVVSAAVLASRVLGLVREQVFAVFFGAGRELDAFITAFRIPNLLRDLFAEGALSAAFVTTFTHRLEREGEARAWRLANLVVNALALVDPGRAARAITGMAVGTLVGGLLQLVVQLPSLRRVGFRYRPLLDFRDAGVREVMRLMAPATIGAAAVQVNVFVNNNFASYLGNGPVSWLNVAFRFMQLPIGLFGVAIGTVTLPLVSRHGARGDKSAFRATVGQALELV